MLNETFAWIFEVPMYMHLCNFVWLS